MEPHAFNPSAWELAAGGSVIRGYGGCVVSSRWALQIWDPNSWSALTPILVSTVMSVNHAMWSQAGMLTFSTMCCPFPIYPNSCKCQTFWVVLSLAQNCVQAAKTCYKSSGFIFIGSLFGCSRRPSDFLWRRGGFSFAVQNQRRW